MNVDFLHNQIIRDTITDKFINSFNENLLPHLSDIYGDELEEIQFYEDHLSDGFRISGEFYYPLTLILSGKSVIQWVKWQVSNYRHYTKFNPFSYKGNEKLEFEILDEVSAELKAKMAGKIIYSGSDALPVVISSPAEDKTFLSGKYSQCFIDELAHRVTELISDEFSIIGLAESGVVLEVRYAPGSFMEHVVENVTYRRILIKARACAARDLWIKWTRLDKKGTYTMADNVRCDDILFELAEDVPGKIKEKEYRYLTAESVDKYQSAMGRKNITEWREMMRRVIRRAEVEKLPEKEKLDEPVYEEEKTKKPQLVEEPVAKEDAVVKDDLCDELSRVLSGAVPELDEESGDEEEINSDLNALLKSVMGIGKTSDAEPVKEEELPESEIKEEKNEEPVPAYSHTVDAAIDEEICAILAKPEENVAPEQEDNEAAVRRELEAKLRAEIEEELRAKREEAEQLRARLEAQLRAETREKELMAEAARAAIEEQRRIAAEREKEKEREREDEQRLELARKKAEEEARIERERAEEEARKKAEKARLEELKKAENKAAEIKYVSKTARLIFRYSVSQDITKRIHEIILATIKYFHKEDVYIRIKATIPDSTTVNLEFTKIPENEIPLLVNIIKVLGRSELGIMKAILD